MWEILESEKKSVRIRFSIRDISDQSNISMVDFLNLLKDSADFREFYSKYLQECPFKAYYWENLPLIPGKMDSDYECSLVKASALENISPDRHTFDQYFNPEEKVVSFPNLGGDAHLVVPCPLKSPAIYTHLGLFVRKADPEQLHPFWKCTASETLKRTGDKTIWLSTSGLGVFWVHARIDTYPKYYQTSEYKEVQS